MLERGCPGQALAVEPGLAFADEWKREMRQRREVAARTDGAPRRNVREDAAVETLDQ